MLACIGLGAGEHDAKNTTRIKTFTVTLQLILWVQEGFPPEEQSIVEAKLLLGKLRLRYVSRCHQFLSAQRGDRFLWCGKVVIPQAIPAH